MPPASDDYQQQAEALDELLCVGPEVPAPSEAILHEWRVLTLTVALRAAAEQAASQENTECAKAIPTTWLDPLLSGPTAVIPKGLTMLGCADVERLLLAIAQRIRHRRGRLTHAIQRVLDDEESQPGGWGPDVTMVAVLRDALAAAPPGEYEQRVRREALGPIRHVLVEEIMPLLPLRIERPQWGPDDLWKTILDARALLAAAIRALVSK